MRLPVLWCWMWRSRGGVARQGRKGKRSVSRLYSHLLTVVATVVTAGTLLAVSDFQQSTLDKPRK